MKDQLPPHQPCIEPDKLENFENAFDARHAGCVRECQCGVTFFDGVNSYDWEPGELERLEADLKAIRLSYSVGMVAFEGKQFCSDCECWHKRAAMIIGFIDGHAHEIADYLTLEKKRKQADADNSPEVES